MPGLPGRDVVHSRGPSCPCFLPCSCSQPYLQAREPGSPELARLPWAEEAQSTHSTQESSRVEKEMHLYPEG